MHKDGVNLTLASAAKRRTRAALTGALMTEKRATAHKKKQKEREKIAKQPWKTDRNKTQGKATDEWARDRKDTRRQSETEEERMDLHTTRTQSIARASTAPSRAGGKCGRPHNRKDSSARRCLRPRYPGPAQSPAIARFCWLRPTAMG